eukprot:2851296-Prorocentrum_lima.AAC.1
MVHDAQRQTSSAEDEVGHSEVEHQQRTQLDTCPLRDDSALPVSSPSANSLSDADTRRRLILDLHLE